MGTIPHQFTQDSRRGVIAMSKPHRSPTGYMREVENLKRELNNMRRFNEALMVIALVLVIALVMGFVLSRSDMADLAEYQERYGSLQQQSVQEHLEELPNSPEMLYELELEYTVAV